MALKADFMAVPFSVAIIRLALAVQMGQPAIWIEARFPLPAL